MIPNEKAVFASFFKDIVDGDTDVWLILADYLDEHDDPRAELVRLTHHLTYVKDDDDSLSEVHVNLKEEGRVQQLLRAGVRPIRPSYVLEVGRLLGQPVLMEMMYVPAGCAYISGPVFDNEESHATSWRTFSLDRSLYVSRYPVTQGQFLAALGYNPSYYISDVMYQNAVLLSKCTAPEKVDRDLHLAGVTDVADQLRLPVENVTDRDVQRFCHHMTYQNDRLVTLLTADEWEYSCRSRSTSPFNFGYTIDRLWSNFIDSRVNKPGYNYYSTRPVGTYIPNAWGLYDCHGQVWDMTVGKTEEIANMSTLFFCGGGLFSTADNCRADCRFQVDMDHSIDYRGPTRGFRVCMRGPV